MSPVFGAHAVARQHMSKRAMLIRLLAEEEAKQVPKPEKADA
jgi:hypothetical protein